MFKDAYMHPGRLCRIAAADETNIPDAFYDKVALWSRSNTWGQILGFMCPNEIVLAVDLDDEGYVKVVWNGLIGFIHSDYLKVIP